MQNDSVDDALEVAWAMCIGECIGLFGTRSMLTYSPKTKLNFRGVNAYALVNLDGINR